MSTGNLTTWVGKLLGSWMALRAGTRLSPVLCPEQDGQDIPSQLAGQATKGSPRPMAAPPTPRLAQPTEKAGNNSLVRNR